MADAIGTGGRPARLAGIEVLRGMAAIAVIFSHVARHLDKWHGAPALIALFQAGHAGVDLFFVISGFIIVHVHRVDIGRPARIGHYLTRRTTRIYPLYWIVLTLTIIAAAGHGLPSVTDALWSAALLPGRHEPLLGIAWTLQFEVAFYAVFALMILRRGLGLAAMGAWGATIVLAATGVTGAVPVFSDVFGTEFVVGMVAALLVRAGRVSAPGATALAGAAGILALLVLEGRGAFDGFSPLARLGYGPACGLLVAGLAARDRQGPMRYPATLRALGAASYSLYLWQFLFIGTAWTVLGAAGFSRLPDAASFAVLCAAAIVGGLVASRTVEKPLLRQLQRRRATTPARDATVERRVSPAVARP